MKKIIYSQPDGTAAVVHPSEGSRLANAMVLADGTRISSPTPVTADSFFRFWPVDGAQAEWAESEDDFVARILQKDVPPNTDAVIVDESAIPADRSMRDFWRHDGKGNITIDTTAAQNALIKEQLEALDIQCGAIRCVRDAVLASGTSNVSVDKLKSAEAQAMLLRKQLHPV